MGMDRRSFVKGVTAALPVVALPACSVENGTATQRSGSDGVLDPGLVRALAEAVLPSEIGAPARERAVSGFRQWLADYRPVRERDHGYGTGELTYTTAHPGPGWRAQLEALELESRQRFGPGFAELDADLRQRLVRGQLRRERGSLPVPAEAQHVAVGLIAWWFASSEANDVCYERVIGRETCRPLERTGDEPSPRARGA
jgi:hypothetical protein